ncbi:hypothetical protein Tco_0206322 [Tanacetum coccineum]
MLISTTMSSRSQKPSKTDSNLLEEKEPQPAAAAGNQGSEASASKEHTSNKEGQDSAEGSRCSLSRAFFGMRKLYLRSISLMKHATVSRSSAEGEYRCMAVLLNATNPVFHEKTKHFEIDVQVVMLLERKFKQLDARVQQGSAHAPQGLQNPFIPTRTYQTTTQAKKPKPVKSGANLLQEWEPKLDAN